MGGIAALVTPPLAAHSCEIPAYAGMVYLGTGVCGRILVLLSAAESVNCRPHNCQNRQTHARLLPA